MGAPGQVAVFAPGYPVTALLLHGGEPANIEAGAKRAALTGQYYRPHAFFMGEPLGSGDQCIAASSAFILSARTKRTSATPSAIATETRCSMDGSPCCFFCRFTERRRADLFDQPISKQSLWAE